MGTIKKYQSGGKSALGMKSVKAGFDKNPGVTRADIIVAAKKEAKGGAKLKKQAAIAIAMKKAGKKPKKARGGASLSPTAANVSKRLGSRLRAGGTLSPTASSVTRRLASPFKNKKARGGASLSPSGTSTSNRLASNLKMKHGGKAHMKKAMGGYKMMKMGGKCRGGCY